MSKEVYNVQVDMEKLDEEAHSGIFNETEQDEYLNNKVIS